MPTMACADPLFQQGWYRYAGHRPSPHYDARPEGMRVDLLVLHNISLPAGQFGTACVDALFLGTLDTQAQPEFAVLQGLRVSSHFFIRRDGSLLQYVSCDQRAWHAGASSFQGRSRCNDFSIGIELEGTDTLPFELAQYDSLAALVGALLQAYPIRALAGHSDIAPGRKTDPGPCFDWSALRRASALAASSFPALEA
ncbi:MAG: 1,6-anhydro-N-acetylmuramyl-L-alanine amidase AmpD [Thiomonas sp.]